jgi:hypothetical protein
MPFIGNKPSAVPLTSADIADGIITSAKIVDGTIVNADINASSAIALSKLSTTGTADATTFLRGDGAYTAVSSDYVLLATTTASSSSSVSFDGYFSSTYDNYEIYLYDVYHSTSATLNARFRKSNADITTSNYKSASYKMYSDNTPTNAITAQRLSWNDSTAIITHGDTPSTLATSSRLQGFIKIFNPLSSSTYKVIQSYLSWVGGSDLNTFHFGGTYSRLEDNTNALSGITLYPASGNFVAGKFKLYGIK